MSHQPTGRPDSQHTAHFSYLGICVWNTGERQMQATSHFKRLLLKCQLNIFFSYLCLGIISSKAQDQHGAVHSCKTFHLDES